MPLFGLPFLNDEEERRRRMLTPGINPDAPSPVSPPNIPMPTRPTPMPMADAPLTPARPNVPLATPPITPRAAPLPEFRPPMPTRAEELGGAKEEYMSKTPGRFKSGLVNALRGFTGGLQTGGGLGAGLGGAVAGGAFGAIDPRGARKRQFEIEEKPQILERFAFEDQETAARRAAEKALLDDLTTRANIANVNSQIRSRTAADALNQNKFGVEQNAPKILNPGQVMVRPGAQPGTWDKAFEVPVAETPPTENQIAAQLLAESGDTVESESQKSLAGRRESLKQRLTPNEQRLVFGQATTSDDPQAVARAHTKWEKIQADELNSIRRDTGERRKAKISQKRFGRKGVPGRTAISVSEAADLLR